MKLLLALLLLSNISIAGWSSGGGDPYDVKVEPFPNKKILADAINLLKVKVANLPFHQNFKDAFMADLEGMVRLGRFYYIPELFAVGFDRHKGDYTKLVSNGAMTEFVDFGAIYFSKRAVEYDARTLARVIAQEIPHHIFRGRFQREEIFANNLGTYIITGGKIPTEPFPAAQIIYEEFDHELRDKGSLRIINEYKTKIATGESVLESLYYLSHALYKLRGSFADYHVEADSTDLISMLSNWPKVAKITPMTDLIYASMKKCVFVPYKDGASGISDVMSGKLTNILRESIKELGSKIKNIYLVEDFYLPATKVITKCGLALEDDNGKVYIYKGVIRHEGNQHGPKMPKP